MVGVFVIFGAHAHQYAALFEAILIPLDAFLRYSPTHQRADQTPASSACARTGYSGCQRPGDNKTKPRKRKTRPDRCDCRRDSADAATDCPADAGTFSRLVPKLGLLPCGGAREVLV